MKIFVRAGLRRLLGVALLAGLAAPAAVGQCPTVAATCTPGAASSPFAGAFGEGIFNVTLGTINNNTVGQADGYRDYACGLPAGTPQIGTTLTVGRAYTLSVHTNGTGTVGGAETVLAWLDYSNDGIFSANEQIMNVARVVGIHTVSFTPSTSAPLGVPLRLRISSDDANSPTPTSCSTPQFSQVEDYAVTLTSNVSPPTAAFTTSGTTTCTGTVQFTDASQNVPTGWLWNFGDNTTSNLQNPSHTYAAPGTYTVTLTTTNAAGTSAMPATATIVYNNMVPTAASCAPATTSYFGGYGITRFRLGTIDNTSADGSAGYEDFSCPQRTALVAGISYPMTINTGGTNQHAIRVYIDGDNDGAFTAAEQVYENLTTPAGGVTTTLPLPITATQNMPLRLRIVADFVGANLGPCVARTNGQVEDYTVTIGPNTVPPVVDFTSNYIAGGCLNPISFTDQSVGLDAGSTWLWNFGDTFTSTAQNPIHQYAASGTYTVSLTVTNANGPATTTKPNYVTITIPCLTYCPSNGTGQNGPGGTQPSQVWITGVGIDAPTPDPSGMSYPAFANSSPMQNRAGYSDYTAQTATLRLGQLHTMTVIINLRNNHRTTVWLDGNHNGDFSDPNEQLFNYSPNMGGMTPQTHVQSFTLTAANGFLLGPTRMRVVAAINNNGNPNPCAIDIQNAEVEDYTVNILPAIITGTREAGALPSLNVYPNPSLDGRLHLALGDAAVAGTYTATVQNLLGSTLLETSVRLTPGTNTMLDLGAVAKGVYLLRLRDAQGRTALRRVVRE